jgi:predicted ATP-dependent protease
VAGRPQHSTRSVELRPEELRWRCDPDALGFETTNDVRPLQGFAGQDRGVDAIGLAIRITAPEYNVFVVGAAGTGRTSVALDLLRKAAAACPASSDWCYLHNFREPERPIAVEVPAGIGRQLADDLDILVTRCRSDLPKLFDGPDYVRRRAESLRRVVAAREAAVRELSVAAAALGFRVEVNPTGVVTEPVIEGTPLNQDAFELLPDAKKNAIQASAQQLQAKIDEVLSDLRGLDREARDAQHAVDRDIALFAVGHLLDALRAKYAPIAGVIRHLDAIQEDLIDHIDDLRAAYEQGGVGEVAGSPFWTRFEANVFVANDPAAGAPVVIEPDPTFANVVGRVDYRSSPIGMSTDYRLLRAGALQRANGGYLVMQARDLLTRPLAFGALKRALRDGAVSVENPTDRVAIPVATLEPDAIPLHVRVVLIGDPELYSLLRDLDEDFAGLFKVKAEFAAVIDRTDMAIETYASFVARSVRERGLLPFSADAVARVIEEGARLAEDRDRLTARFGLVEEILLEADATARQRAQKTVRAADVNAALEARGRRSDLLEVELQRLIDEGVIAIETDSKVIGQVNGLAVRELGDYAFARPTRITARTGPGFEGVVDIERQIHLSGPSHTKGVLTLAGYLLGKYGQRQPLALTARLTFEQTYGGVDGDSASSPELYAVLSSLADLPIDQGIAVTGSVDQRGDVQAIGGVNEKIEGHFAVCKARGLTGHQGVIIPKANVRNLMLAPEVVAAVDAGRFDVWAVTSIDEGIELLTGVPAGEPGTDGTYGPNTVYGRVQAKLAGYAQNLERYARPRPPSPDGRSRTRRTPHPTK